MTGILGVSIADKLKKDILTKTDTEKSEDPQWCGFINNYTIILIQNGKFRILSEISNSSFSHHICPKLLNNVLLHNFFSREGDCHQRRMLNFIFGLVWIKTDFKLNTFLISKVNLRF